jgi:hypothetical protein
VNLVARISLALCVLSLFVSVALHCIVGMRMARVSRSRRWYSELASFLLSGALQNDLLTFLRAEGVPPGRWDYVLHASERTARITLGGSLLMALLALIGEALLR